MLQGCAGLRRDEVMAEKVNRAEVHRRFFVGISPPWASGCRPFTSSWIVGTVFDLKRFDILLATTWAPTTTRVASIGDTEHNRGHSS